MAFVSSKAVTWTIGRITRNRAQTTVGTTVMIMMMFVIDSAWWWGRHIGCSRCCRATWVTWKQFILVLDKFRDEKIKQTWRTRRSRAHRVETRRLRDFFAHGVRVRADAVWAGWTGNLLTECNESSKLGSINVSCLHSSSCNRRCNCSPTRQSSMCRSLKSVDWCALGISHIARATAAEQRHSELSSQSTVDTRPCDRLEESFGKAINR